MAIPYVSPRFSADAFSINVQGLNPIQRVLSSTTVGGTVTYSPYDPPVIKAPLKSVADAVESAYILTPKADLPKVTSRGEDFTRIYQVEGVSNGLALPGEDTPAQARKRATAWLAIAQHLEAEEKAKADEEAKAKTTAEAHRIKRLDELADEWFGKDYADLGPNKAAAIKEIHRLETIIAKEDAA